jgi:uncharacterized membrane protein
MARDEELAKPESAAAEPAAGAEGAARLVGPVFPGTRTEFITVLAHYHRAEIARMAGWRDRIDRTSNWAITVVGAMLSVSLSTPTAHHGVVLFAMVLVLLLLTIEARRYRFFDVYRSRVRRLERNYYAPLFAPGIKDEDGWMRRSARICAGRSSSSAGSRRCRGACAGTTAGCS